MQLLQLQNQLNHLNCLAPLLRNTARAFSAGKNIEAAAILEGEISSIADLTAQVF